MAVSEKRWDVIGIGENSVDFAYVLPSYPQPYGPAAKMRIRQRRVLCGGEMATAMCACASPGLRAKDVGVARTDRKGPGNCAGARPPDGGGNGLVLRPGEKRLAGLL